MKLVASWVRFPSQTLDRQAPLPFTKTRLHKWTLHPLLMAWFESIRRNITPGAQGVAISVCPFGNNLIRALNLNFFGLDPLAQISLTSLLALLAYFVEQAEPKILRLVLLVHFPVDIYNLSTHVAPTFVGPCPTPEQDCKRLTTLYLHLYFTLLCLCKQKPSHYVKP